MDRNPYQDAANRAMIRLFRGLPTPYGRAREVPNRGEPKVRVSIGKFGPEAIQEIVERMTNWQRNQWARAGHPVKLKELREFIKLERHHG